MNESKPVPVPHNRWMSVDTIICRLKQKLKQKGHPPSSVIVAREDIQALVEWYDSNDTRPEDLHRQSVS